MLILWLLLLQTKFFVFLPRCSCLFLWICGGLTCCLVIRIKISDPSWFLTVSTQDYAIISSIAQQHYPPPHHQKSDLIREDSLICHDPNIFDDVLDWSKICSGFSITSSRKFWVNFLANSILLGNKSQVVASLLPFLDNKSSIWESDSPLLLFSHPIMSDSLPPHGLQHARLHCPSLSPRVGLNSCLLSQWCHSTISFSVTCFSSP